MSSAYEAAMTKERERLKAAQKRNFEYSQRDLDEEEVVEDAWGRVFEAGASQIPDEAADAKRRRLEKKAEKRASKRAHEAANAGNWSVYVSGIPKDLSYTAVHSLFSKAGEVRRVKLYKDSSGNQKGDGLVTFGSEAAVRAALERDDWQLFGEMLTVQPATFTEKPTVAREEWARVVVLCGLFSQEEIAEAEDRKEFVNSLEEEVWRECAKFGSVERVQCFPVDGACPLVVLFETEDSARVCIAAMHGRFFNGRNVEAEGYDGNRKRAIALEVDTERQARLLPPPPPPPQPEPSAVPPSGASQSASAQSAQSAPSAPSAPPSPLTLPLNGYVKLRALRNAAERNGQIGVVEDFNEEKGRYMVKLRGGALLALKPENLLQMLQVKLIDLEGEYARYNGKSGTIFDFDDESEMYGVEMEDAEAIPAAAANVLLPVGARARVRGLQGAPQYNGCIAEVVEHDGESGRCLVRLDADKQLRLRRQNLSA